MMRAFRHPPFERLSEFSDGSLAPDRATRVAEHLEGCPRCAGELRSIREADEAIRRVPVPALPEDLFARILARRASGIRTIVPNSPVRRAPRRENWAPAGVSVATVIIAVLVVLFIPTRNVEAGASVLRLDPVAGDATRLEAAYAPASLLRDARTVHVRARVRPEGDPEAAYTVDLGTLELGGDTFTGALRLPRGTAHAFLAIEDSSGEVIDVNGGSFWESRKNSGDTPSAAALVSRVSALKELSDQGLVTPAQVRFAAIQATALQPSSVELWTLRALYEMRAATRPEVRDAVFQTHGDRLSGFIGGLTETPSPDRLADLIDYASLIEDAEAAGGLLERLEDIAPRHRAVIEHRAFGHYAAAAGDPAAALAGLNVEFREVELYNHFIATTGYMVARDAADPNAMLLWARRIYEGDPDSRDGIAIELSEVPELAEQAITMLRDRLAYYATDAIAERALHQSMDDFRARTRSKVARLQAALGTLLIETGQIAEGLHALQQSILERWNPAVASRVAELTATRSPVRAAELASLVRVDPLYDGTIPPVGGDYTGSARDGAIRHLADRLLAGVREGRVPDVSLRSRVGDDVPLDDGAVTVIALWQVPPGPDAPEVEELAMYAGRLAAEGVRLLIATPEDHVDRAGEIATAVGARPVVDADAAATEGFGGWDVWEYIVVHDGSYSVHYEIQDATRLALLQTEISRRVR